jgi:hypothetical protein
MANDNLVKGPSMGERLGGIAIIFFFLYWLVVLPGIYIYNFFQLENPEDRPKVLKALFSRPRTWFWIISALPFYIIIFRWFMGYK